jgi:hypothetical protein
LPATGQKAGAIVHKQCRKSNMRRVFIAGLAIAPVAWPCAVQAQQSAIPLFQTLPLWAQFALLIGPAASAVFAATGLLLTFYQSRRADAQARAALVAEYLKSFAEDEDIQRAYYAVAYSRFVYTDDFHGSESERDIDKLLRHFSNIALAWQAGLLSTHDVRPIQYYVLRVTRNDEVRRYLKFMADWSKQQNLGEHPYVVLDQLSEQLSSRSQ